MRSWQAQTRSLVQNAAEGALVPLVVRPAAQGVHGGRGLVALPPGEKLPWAQLAQGPELTDPVPAAQGISTVWEGGGSGGRVS